MVLVIGVLISFIAGSFIGLFSSTPTSSSGTHEPISSGIVQETAYYEDQSGDWVYDSSKMEEGLRYFYEKTNVQPYVIILANGSMTSTSELGDYAAERYDELFDDEGHFLLVFCDDGSGGFNCGYAVGTAAATVMDSSSISELQSQLNYSYTYAASDEEVFSDAFRATAQNIMKVDSSLLGVDLGTNVTVIGCGISAVAAVMVGLKGRAEQKREKERLEQEKFEEMLNTPLEKMGDPDIEDLAKKYESGKSSTSGSGKAAN